MDGFACRPCAAENADHPDGVAPDGNTYKPTKGKMDVDLQKIPLITYKTTQAEIGGNFGKFLHLPFIPHTTEN